jgi:hypothetical protein
MGITLSCGHRAEDFDEAHNIATKAWEINEEGWGRAIHYSSVCETCKKDYEAEGAILYSDEEENNWLKGEEE